MLVKFLWYKIKKAKYCAVAALILGLFLGMSPYLAIGLIMIALAFDWLLDLID